MARRLRPLPRVLGCAAAMLAAAALAGCVTRQPMTADYDGPQSLPANLAEAFRFEYESEAPRTDSLRNRRDFAVHEVILPAVKGVLGKAELGEVRLEYYDIAGAEVTPVIVVLPIANGNMLVSRYFGRYFADRGWATVVVDRLEDPLESVLDDPESVIKRNIFDYRRILDWIDEQPELGEIGIFGISFGGMAAVMLAALDDRVDAVVAAMAGGDLPYLMMNTSYRAVARQINQALRESGISRERLEERLSAMIDSDPLRFAPYVDAEDILLVMTRTDMIVPFEAQEKLRRELGEPETLYLPTGHRTSVFYFPLLRNSAWAFFERQFSARN